MSKKNQHSITCPTDEIWNPVVDKIAIPISQLIQILLTAVRDDRLIVTLEGEVEVNNAPDH